MNAWSELVGGVLVVTGALIAIGAGWMGYRLADAHARQLELEREKYGTAGLPGRAGADGQLSR